MKNIDRMIAEAKADLEQGKCGKCTPGKWQERVLFLLRVERLRLDGCSQETIEALAERYGSGQ